MKKMLEGLRIIDLSSVVMGPYCTMMLGDMGADVIKVEKPEGDVTRYVGPSRNKGMGSNFLNLNRNKRSIVLNLKKEGDYKKLLKLIESCDVLVHSFRPQTMDKLGLSYEKVYEINKQVIYCGLYGYGNEGDYSGNPAYDDIIQGGSGLVSAQEKLSGTPQYVASLLADKTTGLIGLSSILSALLYREKTGIGQEIEVPMFETMVSYNLIEHLYGETFSPSVGPAFYTRATTPNRKPYKTKNGYLSVLVYNDKQWSKFLTMINRKDLIENERFKDINSRSENITFVYKFLEDILLTKTNEEWIEKFKVNDIPYMPINEPKDLLNDPHLNSVNFFSIYNHPTEGKIKNIKFPVKFSETPVTTERLAPNLGEHNEEINNELYKQNRL